MVSNSTHAHIQRFASVQGSNPVHRRRRTLPCRQTEFFHLCFFTVYLLEITFIFRISNKLSIIITKMAVNSATSFVLSAILTLLLFSGMQMYKPWLIKSPITIIFGGYLGSLMFMFFVTAVGNLEATLFGKNFQLKLPEIVLSMVVSLVAAGMVHRICFTTCLIFSVITIYYMNKLSQKTYATATTAVSASVKGRRAKQ